MSLNDDIKKYIVRISYKDNSNGSGVIVNTDDDKYFYILTAKHTFFTHTDNEKMDENEIVKEKIKIIDSTDKSFKAIETIIGIEKKYDFLILVIKKDKQIDIEPLSIYEDDFKECKICGYPNSKIADDNKAILLPCSYNIRHEEKNTYEVSSNTLLEAIHPNLNANSKMKGISGSGVFVESATRKLYLAGIQIQTASHNSLVCLDIRILAREINKALENHKYKPIHVDGYVIKDELGLNTDDLEAFEDMLNELKDEEFDAKYQLKTKSYEELINLFNKEIKQKLDTKSKELANKYLYLSLLFHKEKDNRRSTVYFKKAVKNNPSYYALFLKAKDERGNLSPEQEEKHKELQLEVSRSDVPIDDMFFKILKEKLKTYEKFYEVEGVYMQMLNLLESKLLDLEKRSENTTEVKDEIISISIELFNKYVEEKKFDDANSLLSKLKKNDYDIVNEKYKLYTDEKFLTHISLSKLDLSKKYLELLEKYKDNSEKFSELKSQLEKVYSDETDVVHNELKTVKQKMVNYEEKVEKLVQIFTTYIDDKEVLNKVGEVDNQLKKSHIKLDNISDTIKSNHDFLIQILLNEVIETNKKLVVGVQKIYKDSKTNEKLVQTLNSTIKYMKQRMKILPTQGDKQSDMKGIEGVIKESNSTLYKNIEKLYEDNTDSIKDNLFRKSLILAEKRHQEHLVSLKRSLEEKKEDIIDFKIQLKKSNQWLDEIKEKYELEKVKSIKVEEEISRLSKEKNFLENSLLKTNNITRDSINLERHQLKIEQLEKMIFGLEEKNKQIDELKESIALSSKTAETLVSLEKTNRDKLEIYLEKIEQKYEELDSKKKNLLEENFSEILKNINSSIDTLSYEPLDKEDFEGILIHLDALDESINNINKKSLSESSEETKKSLEVLHNIQGIESNYKLNQEEYFRKIEKFYDETTNKVFKNKSDKILVKHLNRIEEEISEIKEKGHLDNDVLFRLDSQLQQIRDYIPKKRSVIERWDYYLSVPRGIVVGGIILVGLIVLLLNEPILLGYI